MFVAENADTCRAEQKTAAIGSRESEPARSQHAQEVPTREQEYIALERAQTAYDPIGARRRLVGRFSPGAAIPKQLPARTLRQNLRCGQAFIFAVVPFDQVRINRSNGAEACQFAGPPRPPQGTREHLCELLSLQALAQSSGVLLAPRREWQVRAPGVLSGKAPRSFTMTRKINLLRWRVHPSEPFGRVKPDCRTTARVNSAG